MRALLSVVRQLFFPPQCIGCGHRFPVQTDGHRVAAFCPVCEGEWERAMRTPCPICGQSYFDCLCMSPALRRAGAAGHVKLVPYGEEPCHRVARRVVLDMKKNTRQHVLDKCASDLADGVRMALHTVGYDGDATLITHLPRSAGNLRRDGVDQAENLAGALSAALDIPHRTLLLRVGRTKTQKRLNAAARRANAKKAFSADPVPPDTCVILVDDVVTTGSNMAAAVRALKKNGAAKVLCVSLACTEKQKR